jgi:hypothetical protein
MRFECRDLERALRTPELMPDARDHASRCPECRRELYLWNEISTLAPSLHEEWESPELWTGIRAAIVAEKKPVRSRRGRWMWMGALAAALVLAAVLWHPWRQAPTNTAEQDRAFLTDQALREVELAEAAYARSIEKLGRVAEAKLAADASPLAASYREKLLLIDSAITDLKATAESNRYNAALRAELASLYRQKQQTLQEVLSNEKGD